MQRALVGDEARVPLAAVFDDPPLRGEIYVYQAEALAIALRPLEVIEERPDEIAHHRRPMLHSIADRAQMLAQEAHALGIAHAAIAIPLVVEGRAVLSNQQRTRVIIA